MTRKTRNTPSSPIEADTDTDETSTESTITPEFFKNSLEELKVELFKKFESQKLKYMVFPMMLMMMMN